MIKIRIVPEAACPVCGAYWGHPDPELDWPNRPKVGDEKGWWWRCYNPRCPVAYYLPETGKVVYESCGGCVHFRGVEGVGVCVLRGVVVSRNGGGCSDWRGA